MGIVSEGLCDANVRPLCRVKFGSSNLQRLPSGNLPLANPKIFGRALETLERIKCCDEVPGAVTEIPKGHGMKIGVKVRLVNQST